MHVPLITTPFLIINIPIILILIIFPILTIPFIFISTLIITIVIPQVDPVNGQAVKKKFEYVTRFVSLPQVLCIQLNRFSFDKSQGLVKHNHRVTFPPVVDMAKFVETKEQAAAATAAAEAVEAGAGAGAGDDDNKEVKAPSTPITPATPVTVPAPPSSSSSVPTPVKPQLYRLRGVLVHLGPSANQGHYYSIIKDNVASATVAANASGGAEEFGTFLKFNDNNVSIMCLHAISFSA